MRIDLRLLDCSIITNFNVFSENISINCRQEQIVNTAGVHTSYLFVTFVYFSSLDCLINYTASVDHP